LFAYNAILLDGNSGELPTSFSHNYFFAELRWSNLRLDTCAELRISGDSFVIADKI